MPQILIKTISHENKTSQRTGKQFESCRIVSVSKDGKDISLSGFGSDITHTWESGDRVDIDLAQNAAGYWNFKENLNSLPSPDRKLALLEKIDRKLDLLLGGQTKLTPPRQEFEFDTTAYGADNTEIKVEDLPF